MKIIEKMKVWRVATGTNPVLAKKLQGLAVAAVMDGKSWTEFLEYFHSNGQQLDRLLGNEQSFNDEYGRAILAYVRASGVCGGGTRFSLVLDDMDTAAKIHLDNITSHTDPSSNPITIPEEIRNFIKGNPTREEMEKYIKANRPRVP